MQLFPRREMFQQLALDFPSFDLESVETCLAFLDTTTQIQSALDIHFERYSLSAGKFTILMQLYVANKGMAPSEFAERSKVTRTTITGLLDGLEREDLIQRQPHQTDRRMLIVNLTDKGKILIENILPEHFSRTKGLMTHLTSREKKTFIKLLNKLCSGSSALSDPIWNNQESSP